MLFEVILYGDDDEPVGKAVVDAATAHEAHAVATRLMRKQYPNINPENYNRTLIMETVCRKEE